MFAELLGKSGGYCRGKGGSMHIADPETGNLGANAIVGGSAAIAAGAALSAKMRGTDQVVVCFFGDGAFGQGVLYEAMNMASLWKLPVIYVCEHNMYGEYTAAREVVAGEPLARPQALGIPVREVDGQEVRAVHGAAVQFVERARRGGGPGFLLCHTYRFRGHHVGDINRSAYRSPDEEDAWTRERDPIRLLGLFLIQQRMTDAAGLERIEQGVRAEIAAGVQFALEAPYPDPGEVTQNVYP